MLQRNKALTLAFGLRNNLSIATCIRNLLSMIAPSNRNGPPTPSRGSRTTNYSFAGSKVMRFTAPPMMHGSLAQSEILHNVFIRHITRVFFKRAEVVGEFSLFAACCFSCLVHVGEECVPQVQDKHGPLENHVFQHEFFRFGTINSNCCGPRSEIAGKQVDKCIANAQVFELCN